MSQLMKMLTIDNVAHELQAARRGCLRGREAAEGCAIWWAS